MTFKIEKGVKLPAKRKSTEYPFSSMKPGDSFLVTKADLAGKKTNPQTLLGNLARQWSLYNKKDWKFSTRKEGDGVRVFRTA